MPCVGFSLGEDIPAMYEFEITDVRIEPIRQAAGQAVTIKANFTNTYGYAIRALYLVSVGWQLPGLPMGGEVIADGLETVLQALEIKEVSLGWTIPSNWLPGEDRWVCVEKR